MITTVRVQEKGQVTIPQEIRRKLKLRKGDLVTFVSTEHGFVIQSLDQAFENLISELSGLLKKRGIEIKDVLSRAQLIGADQLAKEYRLKPSERLVLLQALQIKAQSAMESLRIAENPAAYEISEEDIEEEIRATRKAKRDEDRS